MARPDRHRRQQRVRETAQARYPSPSPREAVAGVLLDSDVVIAILRGRPKTSGELRATEAQGVPTYCCAVAWAEIVAGLRPGGETVTEAFFQARGDVVIDAETGRRAGGYLSRHAKSHGVEIADALVAAAASTTGLHLWTLTHKHYPMDDVRFYAPLLMD
jgi:predicted nucleic acid-binding protein